MAFVGKSLADGTLPVAKTTLYTVPATTRAVIKQINCVHNGSVGTVQRVEIFVKRSGSTSKYLCDVSALASAERIEALDSGLTLAAGDIIEGRTTTVSVVDYVIDGAEETP